jgi:hypothetical protein
MPTTHAGRELPTQLGEAGSGALSSPLTQQPRKFNYAYQLLVDIFTCCFREMAEPLSIGTPHEAQRPQALKRHNSVCDVTALSKAVQHGAKQNRIAFGDLDRGIQRGINSGPIHLPPGTSVILGVSSKWAQAPWPL